MFACPSRDEGCLNVSIRVNKRLSTSYEERNACPGMFKYWVIPRRHTLIVTSMPFPSSPTTSLFAAINPILLTAGIRRIDGEFTLSSRALP